MNNNNIELEEDEIDIHKIILHLKENLKTIFFITFLITLFAITYAYFTPSIYSSSVSISFPDNKTSKLSSIIPSEFSALTEGSTESELETIKLTIETRNFINLVLKELDLSQKYFIEKHYKKTEVYDFDGLKIALTVHDNNNDDDTLYEKLFEIKPIDKNTYLLKNDFLDYGEIHAYKQNVHTDNFSIHVERTNLLTEEKYFISKNDETLIADSILKNMQVAILSDNVMKISYSHNVAQKAKEVVETIGNKLIEYRLDQKRKELTKTSEFLDQQLMGIKLQLQGQGNALKEYQQKSETFMPMESSINLFDIVNKKEEDLKALKLQINEIRSFKLALKQNRLNTVSLLNSGINIMSIQTLIEQFRTDNLAINDLNLQFSNIGKAITNNPQLTLLIKMLNEKKELLTELNFNFTEGHPQVVQTSSDIERLQGKIKSYIRTNLKKLEQNQRSTKTKIRNNIITTEKNIQAKLNVLKEDLQDKKALLHSLPKKDLDMQGLKRQFTLSENIYTFLLQKKMEIEITKASTLANTQVIENAIQALKPTKPNKKLIVIVGLILGLMLGVLYSAIRSMLDTKIRNALTVTELTDAPLYGILPDIQNKRFFDEALRSIRTNLQFVLPNEKKCINMMISSSVAEEGKTTIIAGLGEVIAQTGKKVLLMDLDLRRPRLYQQVNKSNKNGMTLYLSKELSIEDCIQSIHEQLDFFPAGAVPPNPSELLMSKKFETLLSNLMERYDYILFDTAPIGSIIDANMLIKYSDIILLVVKANVTDKVYLENFNRLRKEKNIKSSGIILNHVKLGKDKNYGYGYGYGYGHKLD